MLLIRALICGGKPAGPGPGQRLVGRRCRSARASQSAEPPWARNHVGGFERIYQIPHILPEGGEGWWGGHSERAWVSNHTQRNQTHTQHRTRAHLCSSEKPSYLYDFWVIEPFAEDALYQREHLLKHNYNLKTKTYIYIENRLQLVNCSTQKHIAYSEIRKQMNEVI